ncbi:MAG: deoxyguanosinetriphosphate triphosphohydrolase [Candidatus Gastranaerophilales bacterium]|nr:deoxyguanosinetriphosphate triphosphohydrolase [Candidatus Gastranaerophilales bacterium]
MQVIADLEDIKNQYLDFEQNYLSNFAAKSINSKGREIFEEPCLLRTEYQRDRDKILHCKAFRRLKHKTQVFISPVGDHYRTRMTHTLEVSQISRTIARALRLNEDLTEAIALGHDLGHTPFGHAGESVLNNLLEGGFKHNEQSVRVVKIIEKLNLTTETIDGILNHTGKVKPNTLEGQIVKIADRIAYLNHDIDDSIRAGLIKESDLPQESLRFFGDTKSSRISYMVIDIVKNSQNKHEISVSPECLEHMLSIRKWMFENIYVDSSAKSEDYKAKNIIESLFEYFIKNKELLSQMPEYINQPIERIAADYIAGMTDRYAIQKFKDLFVPTSWQGDCNFKT